jgi:uncharacterized protein with HEPN domain
VPSKDPIQRFEDILENIVLVEEFTRGMDRSAFLEDLKTRNATERCMERISEAARKLGELAEELCPTVPWSNVRALTWISHEHVPIGQPSAGRQCACLIEPWSAYQRDTSP